MTLVIIGVSLSEPHIDDRNVRNLHIITSDMQGLAWGEPELAYEYDFDVKNGSLKYAFCSSEHISVFSTVSVTL